jgi:hypothetical protein
MARNENLGHRGNGDPNRPSVQKRRAARAAERKRLAKNERARERRAAAKAAKPE